MKRIKRALLLTLVTGAASVGVTGFTATPAHACHDPWSGKDVCVGVGNCHIVEIQETDPTSWRIDPPYSGVMNGECLKGEESP